MRHYARSNTISHVLHQLRRDIILYRYQNGEHVTEQQLSCKYECSRSAVRGACMVLEQEGLMVSKKNGTREISCLTKEDIDHLYELREFLELSAMRYVTAQKSPDLATLFLISSQFGSSTDAEQLLELDAQFHTALIKISKNKALTQAWLNIADVLREVFSMNMTESEDYRNWFVQTFRDRHMALLTELLHHPQGMEAALKQHIDDAHAISAKAVANLEKQANGAMAVDRLSAT